MATIAPVATSIAAFVGLAQAGPFDSPTAIASFAAYLAAFGPLNVSSELGFAVQQFFLNGGARCYVVRVQTVSAQSLDALDAVPLFNLLCLPGVYDRALLSAAAAYCVKRRAFLIADCDPRAGTPELLVATMKQPGLEHGESAAVYGPWLQIPDPLNPGQSRTVAPSGSVAGVYAQTDLSRGVWTAPAGLNAAIMGAEGLVFSATDLETAELLEAGLNPIRQLPAGGIVVWGARTLAGAGSQHQYVPVRRLLLFLEQSIIAGTEWARLVANTPALWASVRLEVQQFLQQMFQQGALRGASASEAYFVSCDQTTMTAEDIQEGRLVIVIGVAAAEPAQFVVIRIQQMTA